MAIQPKYVFITVDPPNPGLLHFAGRTIPTLETYKFEIRGTIDETVKANTGHIPVGSTIRVTTDARCDTYLLSASLNPA